MAAACTAIAPSKAHFSAAAFFQDASPVEPRRTLSHDQPIWSIFCLISAVWPLSLRKSAA